MRARTVAREKDGRDQSCLCSLGFRTLNHSIRKSLVKAVGNAKEEHANTRGVRESVSLLKRAFSLSFALSFWSFFREGRREVYNTLNKHHSSREELENSFVSLLLLQYSLRRALVFFVEEDESEEEEEEKVRREYYTNTR